jgi:Ca2+-transporting ATPase
MRDGELRSLFAKYLVPGDMVDLAVGDRIPADLRLVTVFDLAVDESSFTGETDPKYKTAAVVDRQVKMSVNDMANVAFQGTLVIGGSARGVVVCTGERSQFGRIKYTYE